MKAVTEAKKAIFLEALKQTCKVTEAAKIAGYTVRAFYYIRDRDEAFREAWQEVEYEVKDRIEAEIMRRGIDGIEKVLFYQGKPIGTEKQYSDRMLELLAYAHIPEKYTKVVKQELTGKDGAPLQGPMDTIEIARRIAFTLRQAEQSIDSPKPEPTPEVVH